MLRLSERVLMASSRSSGLSRPDGRTTFSISVRVMRGSRTAAITSCVSVPSTCCRHQRDKAWKISFSLAANESRLTTVSRAVCRHRCLNQTGVALYSLAKLCSFCFHCQKLLVVPFTFLFYITSVEVPSELSWLQTTDWSKRTVTCTKPPELFYLVSFNSTQKTF